MLEEILEKEMRNKSMAIMENMSTEFKYQIESICETWARMQVVSYFQLMLDYCKAKGETQQEELEEEQNGLY